MRVDCHGIAQRHIQLLVDARQISEMICGKISKLIKNSYVRGGSQPKVTTKSNINRGLGCRYLLGRLQYRSNNKPFFSRSLIKTIQESLSNQNTHMLIQSRRTSDSSMAFKIS